MANDNVYSFKNNSESQGHISFIMIELHFYTEEFSSFNTQGTNSRNINIYL